MHGELFEKWKRRWKRKMRVRKKVKTTPERPRMCVFRSNKHMQVQIIENNGYVLAAASTLDKRIKWKMKTWTCEAARELGKLIAEKALAKGITKVVFDRGGYKFHGRVKSLYEAVKENGIQV